MGNSSEKAANAAEPDVLSKLPSADVEASEHPNINLDSGAESATIAPAMATSTESADTAPTSKAAPSTMAADAAAVAPQSVLQTVIAYDEKCSKSAFDVQTLARLQSVSTQCRDGVRAHLARSEPAPVLIGGVSVDLDEIPGIPAKISGSVHVLSPGCIGQKGPDAWYALPPMPTPRALAAACTLPDGRIFVAGGIDKLNHANALANPAVFAEENMTMMGQPAHERGKMYEYRGRQGQHGRKTRVVEIFDPATNTWATLLPLPIAVAGARAAVSGDGQQPVEVLRNA